MSTDLQSGSTVEVCGCVQAHMQAEAAAATLTAAAAAASGESEGRFLDTAAVRGEVPSAASHMDSAHSLQHSTQGNEPLAFTSPVRCHFPSLPPRRIQ